MRKVRIPKGNGKFRLIYVPSHKEKKRLRRILPEIAAAARRADIHNVQYGFVEGRSPVMNASMHVGFQFTLSMDLSDFFDHVTEEHLRGKLPKKLFKYILVDGAARQGLPTSPAVANLAAAAMDADIVRMISYQGEPMFYTRYADDMTISCMTSATAQGIVHEVIRVAEEHKFTVNPNKTKIQSARAGRRNITGVMVDDEGNLYPTRKVRRGLRMEQFLQSKAAENCNRLQQYRSKISRGDKKNEKPLLDKRIAKQEKELHERGMRIDGLKEWSKMAMPSGFQERTISRDTDDTFDGDVFDAPDLYTGRTISRSDD